jgi:metal-dependent amidase/aminoacylase/carboxypeptidase family protein
MHFKVKVLGKPAHVACAHRSVDAIAKAFKICNALMALNYVRQRRIKYPPAEIEPV